MTRLRYLLHITFLLFISPPGITSNDALNFLEEEESEIREENGVLILTDVEHVSDLLHQNDSALLLAALYSPTCPFSTELVQKLEEASESLASYFQSVQSVKANVPVVPPQVAKLDATKVDPSWIQTLGIDSYPSLFFFRQVKDETVVMEYMGLKEDPSDMVQTILHYWYRYAWGPIFPMESLDNIQAFINDNGPGLLRHVPPAWNTDYTAEEKATISWLMDSDEDAPDHYVLFVQCRSSENPSSENPSSEDPSSYKSFSDLAKIVSTQRDVALFSISDCSNKWNDGDVFSIFVNPETWQLEEPQRIPPHMELNQFAVIMTTPSVLLYDRVSTGPIAFANYRRVHAVLFVRLTEDEKSFQAIRSFRQSCQAHKLHRNRLLEDDLVCLVILETETRIMSYFGVDVWTPLDAKVSHGTDVPELLPVLLITDQRGDQFRRYYLDAADIVGVQDHHPATSSDMIPSFMAKFWTNDLTPEIKSSSRPVRKNKAGVEIINGQAFGEVVMDRKDKHTLLYLYAPTCGHCKRFAVVWNELSKIVQAAAWDSVLDIVQMDITENEIVDPRVVIDPAFVPAIYYFSAASGDGEKKEQVVQFNVRDKFGDSVGRLRDPLDIIDWMLSFGHFDEVKILEELEELEREDKEEKEAA
eukprot:CAMPEP_0119016216 /NCGR_PEP_ID=MMETSP1176-20130426/11876_1 /TAXON_ID=265551 /ORGANISM="Synedropsis recta cf, Strain CCMP1620" /LENGTH=642 /DNA_ID=CAMNT_0006969557 /DNA_START=49 /DNA_END=1973 /DNA_ORIENTATION=+